jgi:hypothetical protein
LVLAFSQAHERKNTSGAVAFDKDQAVTKFAAGRWKGTVISGIVSMPSQ